MGIELHFDERLNNQERKELVRKVHYLSKKYAIKGEGVAHVAFLSGTGYYARRVGKPSHPLPGIQIRPNEQSRIEELCKRREGLPEGIVLKGTPEYVDLQFKKQIYRVWFKGFDECFDA